MKLAYQVRLTSRGHLITLFVLGSMSVGLKILIRHSFMDLCRLDYGLGYMTTTTLQHGFWSLNIVNISFPLNIL